MKLTRKKRVALEVFGPPALGAGIYSLLPIANAISGILGDKTAGWHILTETGALVGIVFLFAYIFVGVQSIIYAAIMEWGFKRGLSPRSWRMVGLSAGLGFASGGIIALGEWDHPQTLLVILAIWGGLGLVVGFLIGLLIKRWSPQ